MAEFVIPITSKVTEGMVRSGPANSAKTRTYCLGLVDESLIWNSDLTETLELYEHQNGLVDGFTKTYGVHTLVYAEEHFNVEDAIRREKAIKKWGRDWKLELIEKGNPEWLDLAERFPV